MKVSFLIVAYHSRDQIEGLLDSINGQQIQGDSETIIVDNSPEESSGDLVRAKFPMVKFIQNQRNKGFTVGVNQAIREAGGEYLFLLNPDIVLKPRCVRSLVGAFSDKNVGVSVPQLTNEDGTIQMSVRNLPQFDTLIYEATGLAKLWPEHRRFGHWRNYSFDHASICSVEQPMASAMMLRRDVVTHVGEWDEQFFVFFSDVDYCKRILDAGYRIMFVPQAKAEHQLGGSTRREGSWLVWDSHRGFRRYLRKHELKGARTLLLPLATFLLWIGGVIRVAIRKTTGGGF